MKKFLFIIFSFITLVAFAHEPLLDITDKKDGYIFISGGYSNGESAAGTPIIIVKDKLYNGEEESYDDKLILFKGVLNENAELLIPKPKTSKYLVIFDGGIGHIVEKKGPKLTKEEMELWEKAINESTILNSWKEKMQDLVK